MTFNLSGMPTGTYTARAEQPGGTQAQMANGLTVVQAVPTNVVEYVATPSVTEPDRQGQVTVNYVNDGNTDALAPLLQLTATNALISLNLTGAFTENTVQFLGISGSGPAGILRPGESGSIQVAFQTTGHVGQSIEFDLGVIDDNQPSDLASQEAALQLPTIPDAAWPVVFANVVANLGSTVATLHAALAADATYLGQLGQPAYDLGQLFFFEVEKAAAAYNSGVLDTETDDSLPAPGMDLTFQRTFQGSISSNYTFGLLGYGWTTNWDVSARGQANGDVILSDDGAIDYYALNANGSYDGGAGNTSVLTLANGAYTLTLANGTVYQFNPGGAFAYVQDANGNRISAGYNIAGQMISLTDSNGEYFDLTYNSAGLLATLSDSAGQTVTYGYDPTNQFLTSCTTEYGTTNYSYVTGQTPQQDNALSEIAFANNSHLYFSFDTQGRLIDEHADNGAEDVSYTYLSPGGYVTTDGDGNQTTILFNIDSATAETIDALGNVTVYRYDANQNLTGIVLPNGATYNFSYDANGNITSETDPLGNTSTFTYDANNYLTSYTDPNGHATSYTYSGGNDLMSVTYANGDEEQYSYNPIGEATSFLDANGASVGLAYNADGLVTKESFAGGTSYSYTYNAQGNLTSATDQSGNVTTFIYGDASNPNLLTEVEYPNGTYLKFTYNVIGQRTQSVDQTGFTVNYIYDAVGRLSELTGANGNLIVQYLYDNAGNLIEQNDGNGTFTVYTYDGDGDILSITNYAPSTGTTMFVAANSKINSFDVYTYDSLGNVLTDTNQDGAWTYTYDADSQLIGAVFAANNSDPDGVPNQNIQYVYDDAGNRISETVNGVLTTYAVNNVNEYVSSTTSGLTTNYQYDADGNLIAQTTGSSTISYTYNVFNQLTSVSGPGQSATYSYDPLGNLVGQTVNGASSTFQVDPNGNLVAAFDNSGNLQAHYTYGIGLISQVSASGTDYYDFNLQGSTIGMTNAAGSYDNTYTYMPFGTVLTSSGSVPNPFQFVGQFGVLAGANLNVMGARAYNPATGQFVSNDPLGLEGGDSNVRRYASNNPSTLIDPQGLGAKGFSDEKATYETLNVFSGLENMWSQQDADDARQLSLQNAQQSEAKKAQFDKVTPPPPATPSPNPHPPIPAPGVPPGTPPTSPPSPASPQALPHTPYPDLNVLPIPKVYREVVNLVYYINIRFFRDPNNIIGPAGFGDENFVPVNQQMPYTIEFENEPTAGLPAQQVIVTQQLDPNLDWGSFRLGNFGFGGQIFQVPANSAYYQTTIEETGYDVLVTATIDEETGSVSWIFTTIDPSTGEIPLDPTIGFLPPDNANGIGEGFVSYTVLPTASDPTGTVINAQATVVFTGNPPLNTPLISNTIDAGTGLTSTVAALPAFEPSPTFNVTWSGTDSASGSAISTYTVYVSDDGGPYTAWQENTTLTSAPFSGQTGHTYAFYSVASDNAGNVQATPTGAQATTTVVYSTSLSEVSGSGTYGGSATLTATLTSDGSPVADASVAFTLTVGGDVIDEGSVMTNSNGIATLNDISLAGLGAGSISDAVGASFGGDTTDASTSTSGDLTITPAALTITPTPQHKTYGQTLSFGSGSTQFTSIGLQNGQTIGSVTLAVNGSGDAAAAPVTAYSITPSAAIGGTFTASNYDITYDTGTLTVNPAALTVTAANESMSYGGTAPALAYTYTGLVNSDTSASFSGSLATSATSSSNVGGYSITEGTLAATGNYTIDTFKPGTLTVSPAPLTITANNASVVAGRPIPSFNVDYSGFVLGQGPVVLGGSLTITTAATTASPAGSYPIAPSGLSSPNYAITYVDGTLAVSPPPVTVESLQVETIKVGIGKKAKNETAIVVDFSGALNAAAADNSGAYELAPVIKVKASGKGKNKKPATTKLGSTVPVVSAAYSNDQVTLVPRAKLTSSKPEELIIDGSLVTDILGRGIDGSDDGIAGSNYIATVAGTRVMPGGIPLVRDRRTPIIVAEVVDQLLAHGELSEPRRAVLK